MTIMFDYTQSKFWNGSWYPYWSLMLMTIIGGFFGLDHVWLRSPLSGFLKCIVNILTLGLWYFYDILQILGEKDSVMKNGLSAPIVGALGIGAGMFKDSNPGGPTARSPLKFIAYMFLLWMPFGIDLYIAGDSNGAMIKFFLTMLLIPFVLPFFIAVIWGFVNIARSTFAPKDLFTKGTYRMFPMSWFMDPFGPSSLGPVDVPNGIGECGTGGVGSVVGDIVGGVFSKIPIVKAATIAIDAVETAANVATTVAKGASSAIETTTDAYKNIVDGVIKPTTQVIGTGVSLGSNLASLKSQGLIDSALTKTIQKGGGISGNNSADLALLALFTLILGGGTISAINRMGLNGSLFNKQKEDANDSPPKP